MMDWKKWKKPVLITVSYVLVAATASALTFFAFGLKPSKLDRLLEYIDQRFIGQADIAQLEDAAAYAIIDAMGDRWSYYIPEDQYADYQDGKKNTFVGIGITIRARNDGVGFDILAVEPDGPASEEGLRAGDILVEAADQPVAGMTASQVSDMITGEAGTEVTVSVIRNGQKHTFTVTRRKLKVAVVQAQMLDGNIGYVRIKNFNTRCADETIAVIKQLQEEGAAAFVFDVRNNPGGYLNEMVEVLDYLLPKGDLVHTEHYDGSKSTDQSDAACVELPMAVLINEDSYSAAELFAAALAEYDWAALVGQPTTGKGYYQNTLMLGDGSAVALSVGKYTTGQGVSLAEAGGLEPDVAVEVDEDTALRIYAGSLEPEEDPQLQAAVEAVGADPA